MCTRPPPGRSRRTDAPCSRQSRISPTHPGSADFARAVAVPVNADLSRMSSSSGRVDRIMARIASSASGSASPVHSSMKNFLNSTAMAQPVVGNSWWMKRVCSPRPWNATFSRTSIGRPRNSNARRCSMNGSTTCAQRCTVHREGADVDLRHQLGAGRRGVGPVAPVIVAVHVEDHEAAELLLQFTQEGAQLPVVAVVQAHGLRGPGRVTGAARRPARPHDCSGFRYMARSRARLRSTAKRE